MRRILIRSHTSVQCNCATGEFLVFLDKPTDILVISRFRIAVRSEPVCPTLPFHQVLWKSPFNDIQIGLPLSLILGMILIINCSRIAFMLSQNELFPDSHGHCLVSGFGVIQKRYNHLTDYTRHPKTPVLGVFRYFGLLNQAIASCAPGSQVALKTLF